MTSPKFYFGEIVKVTGKLHRTRPDSKTRNWMILASSTRHVIFLGYRTLASGTVDWEYGTYPDEGSNLYFKAKTYHKAALVCQKDRKPEYAFLDMIEKLP